MSLIKTTSKKQEPHIQAYKNDCPHASLIFAMKNTAATIGPLAGLDDGNLPTHIDLGESPELLG